MTLAATSPGSFLPGSRDTVTVTDRLSGLSFTPVTVPTVTPLLLAVSPLMSPAVSGSTVFTVVRGAKGSRRRANRP